MLNISENSIKDRIDTRPFKSFGRLKESNSSKVFVRVLGASLVIFIICLFLPWTQNIQSRGYVTTLKPDQRPQTVHAIIDGRIESWFVTEGDYVSKGDTVIFISETKDAYFDPDLLERTEEQITSKELKVDAYMDKVRSLDSQIDAMLETKKLKIEQAENYRRQAILKIESDSIDLEAAKTNLEIAENRLERFEQLYEDGLKSLSELESKKLKLQETQAKRISAENKLLSSQNDLINAQVELNSIDNQYKDKIAKAEAEKYAALSDMYDAEAVVTKMQNQYMNYSIRSGLYYITAPQNGYITKAIKTGIGETIKQGDDLVSIMPADYDLAVSMYIAPMDVPLVETGQHVRFLFDGWPTIVFSGWPNLSYGTFGGEVVAIDNFISPNGKYRILVAPDPDDEPWPEALRIGSGANGLALLKNVPIWYELWRRLNGFPPDYYKTESAKESDSKK